MIMANLATNNNNNKKKKVSCGSFTGDFSPNFDLKNMILTYRKDF
jgi:hypothetical protein